MIFLLRYWRHIAALILLAALVASFLGYRHSLIQSGIAIGEGRVQAKWDKDEAAEKLVADVATQKAREQDAADDARNKEIEHANALEVAAANADRDRTFRLLQRARATTDTIRASQGADIAQPSGASTQGSNDEADGLLADTITECRLNSAQLDALILEIVPQLPPRTK